MEAASEETTMSEPTHKQYKLTLAGIFPPMVRYAIDEKYAHTRELAEVFQVRIDKFDDMERRGELYGKIEVVDNDGTVTLYNRGRRNPEHIHANCNITLSELPRSVTATIGFTINIDLRLCSDSEDVALSRWQLSWDAMNPQVAHIARGRFLHDFSQPNMLSSQMNCKHQLAGYDQPLSVSFQGPNDSCITLCYAIFEHAVHAFVEVQIIDTNAVPTITEYHVHGAIYASYGHFECGNDSYSKDDYKSTLFKTSASKSVNAQRWKSLQLSRRIVAVPAYTSLIIEADLWDTSHLKLAQGKVEFKPHSKGMKVDYIRGDVDANVAVRVIVKWSFESKLPRSLEW